MWLVGFFFEPRPRFWSGLTAVSVGTNFLAFESKLGYRQLWLNGSLV